MFEAFRVGPVDTEEGSFVMYGGCSPELGAVNAIAKNDRDGLAQLREQAPKGALSCEPALARAGRALGFQAAELGDEARHLRALLATMLSWGPSVDPGAFPAVEQLLAVAQKFMRDRPFQLVRSEVPIDLEIELAGRARTYAASVLGADGIDFGVALHPDAAAMERFLQLAEEERLEEVRRATFRSLTIGPEPAWVAEAVGAAFGSPLAVVPMSNGPHGARVVTADDLAELVAAMLAVTRLAPGQLTAEVTIEVEGGGQCKATAKVESMMPAWATRPLKISGDVPPAVLTVPMLAVPDLDAVAAGLRALGFEVNRDGRRATASWPGAVLELTHTPSARVAACRIVVTSIDMLEKLWSHVPMHLVDTDAGPLMLVELPGGLNLAFAEQAASRSKNKKARRRKS